MRSLKDDLRELDLFSEASRSELAVIARQLTRLKVKAGRVLVREGGIGNEFMIMVDGMAEVTQGGRSVATIGRGDLVGEMALLQPYGSGRRNATVTAVDRCGDLRRLAGRVPQHPGGFPVGGQEGARARLSLGRSWRRRSSPHSSTHRRRGPSGLAVASVLRAVARW